MYDTLLLPLDGSEFSEQALPLATVVARTLGAQLHLVHVVRHAPDMSLQSPQEDFAWLEHARESADAYLEERADEVREEGVTTHTAVLDGRVVPALKAYASEKGVNLAVLTSHGSGGVRRWWLGSVADGLLSATEMDLLLVRPWDETEDRMQAPSRFQRIVVPLDGSEMAETALPAARLLAERFKAGLSLMRVVPKPLELTSIYGVRGVEIAGEGHEARVSEATRYLDDVARSIDAPSPDTHVFESSGAADGIVEGARKLEADLITLSSRGKSGITRVVLGSVADKVVRATTRPVLVIRHHSEP